MTKPRCWSLSRDFQIRPIVLLNWELSLFFKVLAFFPGPGMAIVPPGLLQTPIVPWSSWPLMLQNKMHSVCERREKSKSFSIAQLVEQLGHSWPPSTRVPAPLHKLEPPARSLAQLQSESKEGMTGGWWLSGELSFHHFPIPNASGLYGLSLNSSHTYLVAAGWKKLEIIPVSFLSALLRIGLRDTTVSSRFTASISRLIWLTSGWS